MVMFAQPSLYDRYMAEILAEDRAAAENRRREASSDFIDQLLLRMCTYANHELIAEGSFFGTPPVPHRVWPA